MINLDNMNNGQLLELRDAIDQKIRGEAEELIPVPKKVIMTTNGWVDIEALVKKTYVSQTMEADVPLKANIKFYTFPGTEVGSVDHEFDSVNDNYDELYDTIGANENIKATISELKENGKKLKEAIIEFANKNSFDEEDVWDCVNDLTDV